MKKIGLLVACETEAIFAYYKDAQKLDAPAGFGLWLCQKPNCELYILHCGMGLVVAAAGTQYLITGCGVSTVVNFGVVGGLTGDMRKHKVVAVEKVIHYRYDATEFLPLALGQVAEHESRDLYCTPDLFAKALTFNSELTPAVCASGDKFVAKESDKLATAETFGATICDMESAGIVLTCEANATPCLLLKAVSDGLADGAKGFWNELLDASLLCLKVADSIIETL